MQIRAVLPQAAHLLDITALAAAFRDRYRIERELGAGGMATVYLAEDLKHHRQVAIKVLRPELAATMGPDRFAREIEVAARLQHPHILGLLDSGDVSGFFYYVMPYVRGETLRERLTKSGELPLADAVRLLCEIADALASAHQQGVVHRDIKPENVLLSGRHAMVMDFGVAKAVTEATGRQQLTTAGVALGTPAYMAPEQATGDPHLDARVDIYALGVLAYEMLTGHPPFHGLTAQQTLAAHVTEAPAPVSARRPGVPAPLEGLIMKCLAKRPADRYQTADELLATLEPLATPSGGTTPTTTRPLPSVQAPRALGKRAAAVTGFLVLVGIGVLLARRSPVPPLELGRRTQVTLDPGLEVNPALSPDGKFLAYAAGTTRETKLFVRQLDAGSTVPITPGVAGNLRRPLWSPDGTRIAFQSPRGIEIIGALGGLPKLLVAGKGQELPADFAWSPDGGTVAYRFRDTLYTRPLDGGASHRIATAFELHSPAWSPDGRWIAYVSGNRDFVSATAYFGNLAPSAVWLAPAAGGRPIQLTDNRSLNTSPIWLPRGRQLLFVSNRDGGRDIYRLALRSSGEPRDTPRRLTTGLNAHSISLSGDGKRLAYSVYTETANAWSLPIPQREPVSISRATPVTTGNQIIETVSVSPDGRWMAFDSDRSGNQDIYKMPLAGGEPEQLTTDPQDDFAPAWSPDGTEIAFHSFRNGNRDIFIVPAAGGPAEPVVVTPAQERGPAWSPDGNRLVFASNQGGRYALYVVSRKEGKWSVPTRLSSEVAIGSRVRFGWSPDGRFIVNLEKQAIDIIPAAGGEERKLVEAKGTLAQSGFENLVWSPDSRFVYYVGNDTRGQEGLWSVALSGSAPRLLVRFDEPGIDFGRGNFALSGNRFYFPLEKREADIWTAQVLTP
ncbi:MAG TPA: protein kinase [Gemmatimonadales bacterium]